MTVTVAEFRQDFTEFSDTTQWPDPQVQFWIDIADLMLNPRFWSDAVPTGKTHSFRDFGIEQFAAHNLALELRAEQQAPRGGAPGIQIGAITAVSAAGASVSYDPNLGVLPEDGHWSLTLYGRRFVRLARWAGKGPLQVRAGWPAGFAGIPIFPAF